MTFIADLWGANKQAKAAKDAANVQAQSAKEANATQLQMFNQARSDAEPWRQAGQVGLNEFMSLLGLSQPTQQSYGGAPSATFGGGSGLSGPLSGSRLPAYKIDQLGGELGDYGDFNGMNTGQLGGMVPLGAPSASPMQSQQDAFARFRSNPGYQFGLDEGMKSVQASAAARGGLNSGAALKSLFKYGNDYADQQGFTPYMNRLASLSNIGQTQNTQNAAMGQNYANQFSANVNNAAAARAQGIYDSANAWTNGVGSATGKITRGLGGLFGGW